MKLYLLTQPFFFKGESVALNHMLEQGNFMLHIRKPCASRDEVEHLLLRINRCYYPRIVLHDFFDLAIYHKLGGIHLNRRSSIIPKNFKGTISRSCHNWEEVVQYRKECDYLFLSPLYDSISKQNYKQTITLDQMQKARKNGWIDHRLVGLGGVTAGRIPYLKAWGLGGVALIGFVWSDYDQTLELKLLLERLQSCLIAAKE